MKYLYRSVFRGWVEVTEEQAEKLLEYLRWDSPGAPDSKKGAYIKSRLHRKGRDDMYFVDDDYENVTEREYLDFCDNIACDPAREILHDESHDGYHHDIVLGDVLGHVEFRHMYVMSCV